MSGIDFDLQLGGALRGVVRNAAGNPLSLVTVFVVDSAGRAVGSGQSDSLGNYSVDGLVAGTYYARTSNTLGLQDQLFGGAPCATGCDPLLGTPISVQGTNTTNAINFNLNQLEPLFRNGFE